LNDDNLPISNHAKERLEKTSSLEWESKALGDDNLPISNQAELEYISVVAWEDVISEVMLKSNGAMGDAIIGSHWRAK
jgi:hypothetical protein